MRWKREKERKIERQRERKVRNRERKERKKREIEREKREKEREKREIERNREKGREKDVQGQLLSICIRLSKRKTKYIYIGRNAQNFKKWLLLRGSIYYNRPLSL